MHYAKRLPFFGNCFKAFSTSVLHRSRALSTQMARAILPRIPEFVPVDDSDYPVKFSSKGTMFRLVSYNILAQVYVKSVFFPHSPSHCLKWKSRSQAVLTVLKGLDADFLCLQELDEYESCYKENMKKEGYASVYVQRTGRKRDGCGIFYKHERAELLLEDQINYNDLVPKDPQNPEEVEEVKSLQDGDNKNLAEVPDGPEDRGDPNDPRVRLKRDCVGLLTAFKLLEPPYPIIIVANTHIYWDPEWIDVKLAQVKYLLSRIACFKEKVSKEFTCIPPVFVAGDFNSTPGDKVYEYLLSGILDEEKRSTSVEKGSIVLHSLYSTLGGEPAFTNVTPDFTGTLDYILFSDPEHVHPITYLKLPSYDSEDIQGGLPNECYPSDHLPIGADFEIQY